MPLIDYNARTVHLRFAVLGPPGAGKRTVVRSLHARQGGAGNAVESRAVGPMERLGFHFWPANVESLDGHRLEADVFALSGQATPSPMWERLLVDLDAVLLVANSRPGTLAEDVAWLRGMGAQPALAEVPAVIFYNQRDLPGCTAIGELETALNPLGALSFGGSAATGVGVDPLLDALVQMAFASRR